jgi:hypothetical protein
MMTLEDLQRMGFKTWRDALKCVPADLRQFDGVIKFEAPLKLKDLARAPVKPPRSIETTYGYMVYKAYEEIEFLNKEDYQVLDMLCDRSFNFAPHEVMKKVSKLTNL